MWLAVRPVQDESFACHDEGPDVSGLETAIRNALERADRANPEIRARIYQSARQALETGLRKQDVTDAETIAAQRQRLEMTIRAIEGEERRRLQSSPVPPDADQIRPPAARAPVAPPAAPPRPTPAVQPPPAAARGPDRSEPVMSVRGERREPAVSAETGDDGVGDMHARPDDHLGVEAAEPLAPVAAGRNLDFKPERAAVRRKPRKFFSRLLALCVLVAFLGMGAWWVKTSGVLMTAAERDTSVRNPPAHVTAEDYDGGDDAGGNASGLARIDPQAGFSSDWIEVVKPSDGSKVVPGSAVKVENVAENEGPAIRVTSQAPDSSGNAAVEIPASVLTQLAGKVSTVALTVQATSDTPTQISVECDFPGLGACGRHRFDVTRETADVLFQLRFDKAEAAGGPGKLLINSAVDGKTSGVNIYAVRILPGE